MVLGYEVYVVAFGIIDYFMQVYNIRVFKPLEDFQLLFNEFVCGLIIASWEFRFQKLLRHRFHSVLLVSL